MLYLVNLQAKGLLRIINRCFGLLIFFITTNTLSVTSVFASPETIKIGYAYGLELYQENVTIKETLQALHARIKGVDFQLIPLSPLDTLSEIKEQHVDFLIGPSNFFVEFRNSIPLTYLATRIRADGKDASKTVGSTIVVRSERNDLNVLKDLKGKKVAASMPNSLGGWLAAVREIKNLHDDTDNFFSNVHFLQFQTPDVVSSVLNGNVDAGILTTCVLEQIEKSGIIQKGSLKVINPQPLDNSGFSCIRSTSDLYPDMSLAALSGTPEWLTREVTITLLSMKPFDGYRWSVEHDQFSIEQLMKDLGLGPYSYLKDTSIKGLVIRFKNEILITILIILFLICNELYLRRLVKQRTNALSKALEEKELANEEAALTRARFSALEKRGIISQLGTIIAHESKQPIGTLSNYLAILQLHLKKNKSNDHFQDEILKTMGEQVERLNALVNSVRNFAKKRHDPLIKTDLILISRKALRNYEATEPGIKKTKVKFKTKLPVAYVLSEPLALELLILNLIKNAYEEASANSREAPEINISIKEIEDDRYQFEISNSGREMTDADIRRITSLGESVKPEGLGLGLSIIRGIADHFGADIKFKRRTGGGVSAFVFFSKYREGEKNNV